MTISKTNLTELRKANQLRASEFGCTNNNLDNIGFTAIELAGEVGEAQDAIKKQIRSIKGLKGGTTELQAKEAISDELGDIIISADRLCECMGKELAFNQEYIPLPNLSQYREFEYALSKLTLRLGIYSGRFQDSCEVSLTVMSASQQPEEFLYFIHKNTTFVLAVAAEISELLQINLWQATVNKFNKTSEKYGFKTTL